MTVVCLGKHRENKAGLVTGFFHGPSPGGVSHISAHLHLAQSRLSGIFVSCEE